MFYSTSNKKTSEKWARHSVRIKTTNQKKTLNTYVNVAKGLQKKKIKSVSLRKSKTDRLPWMYLSDQVFKE